MKYHQLFQTKKLLPCWPVKVIVASRETVKFFLYSKGSLGPHFISIQTSEQFFRKVIIKCSQAGEKKHKKGLWFIEWNWPFSTGRQTTRRWTLQSPKKTNFPTVTRKMPVMEAKTFFVPNKIDVVGSLQGPNWLV